MKTAPIHLAIPKASYTLKEGTEDTFIKLYGCTTLPDTISYFPYCHCCMDRTKTVKNGKIHKQVGAISGQFEPSEHSPLMKHDPYIMGTGIIHIENYPRILGYGQICISDEEGDVNECTQDLIVLVSPDYGLRNILIYYFEGMAGEADKFVAYLNSRV